MELFKKPNEISVTTGDVYSRLMWRGEGCREGIRLVAYQDQGDDRGRQGQDCISQGTPQAVITLRFPLGGAEHEAVVQMLRDAQVQAVMNRLGLFKDIEH